jgi:hypothetical protein
MGEVYGDRQSARLGEPPLNETIRDLRAPVVLGALLLLLAGCAGQTDTGADPLLGARAAAPAVAPSGPAAQPAAQVKPLPPMPAPSALTSNAALAQGGPQPLQGGFDLRIGNNAGGSAPGTWVGPPSPGPSPVPAQPTSRTNTPGQPTTFEEAQRLLAAYGVTWQRLENADGVWKFTCSVPKRGSPNVSRTYEAQAKDDIGAIRAALEQIDREQR